MPFVREAGTRMRTKRVRMRPKGQLGKARRLTVFPTVAVVMGPPHSVEKQGARVVTPKLRKSLNLGPSRRMVLARVLRTIYMPASEQRGPTRMPSFDAVRP
jgi:hypothetical protein